MKKKEVIYIGVEDDITTIIGKLKDAKAKIVALVPPKRSITLNSVVNVKLLMRAAEESGKRVVLITSDKTLISLAGGVGLHVANNLQSKPYLPEAPQTPIAEDSVIVGDLSDLDPQTPVGELSPQAGKDDNKQEEQKSGDDQDVKTEKPKKKKDKTKKGFKIPDFERFRAKLFIGVFIILLLAVGWWWAFKVAPRASIDIQAQTSQLDTNINFTLDPDAKESDIDKKILSGEVKELKKTVTEEFEATGEKNVGTKASGTITVTNHCYNPELIGSGTRFTSNSGLVFIATQDVPIADAVPNAGSCVGQETTADVPVEAETSGDNYNLAPTGYTVEDFPSSDLSGYGSQMSGGTTVIKKVVSQEDFDKAKASFSDKDFTKEKQELAKLFGNDLIGIETTFTSKIGKVSSTPAVGEEADKAIMSVEMIFNEIGVKAADLQALLAKAQEPEYDVPTQTIYDDGLSSAQYTLVKKDDGKYIYKLHTIGVVGPDIDVDKLSQQITGERYSAAQSIINNIPGVISSDINLSPFWVNKIPEPAKTAIKIDISEEPGSQ